MVDGGVIPPNPTSKNCPECDAKMKFISVTGKARVDTGWKCPECGYDEEA